MAFSRWSGERLFTKAVAADAIVLDDRCAEIIVLAIKTRTHPVASRNREERNMVMAGPPSLQIVIPCAGYEPLHLGLRFLGRSGNSGCSAEASQSPPNSGVPMFRADPSWP